MRRFNQNQRIIVIDRESPMFGKTGKVSRLRYADSYAWIEMDEQPPRECCPFSPQDSYGRGKHVLFDPSQCEAA